MYAVDAPRMSVDPAKPTVIIVNFNSGQQLLTCLAALDSQTADHSVLVIDNASSDGSARRAHEQFLQVRFLPLRYNVGFCRAVNIGVVRSPGEHIIMLNPDTAPEPEFVERIVEPFAGNPQIASVAGTLVFESAPETIASAGIAYHRNGVAIDHLLGAPVRETMTPSPVFGPSGGAAAYRRDAFIEAGGFPEHYFMYLEDADLAWRLRLAGWESVWAPAAVARHGYSSAAGEGSPLKQRLLARNRIWMIVRCLPDQLLRDSAWTVLEHDIKAAGYGLLTGSWRTAAGRGEALARLAPRLCERRQIQRSRKSSLADLERWVQGPITPDRILQLKRLTTRLASSRDTGG